MADGWAGEKLWAATTHPFLGVGVNRVAAFSKLQAGATDGKSPRLSWGLFSRVCIR